MKTLGLVSLLVLAFTAFVGTGLASASVSIKNGKFVASSYPSTITGTGQHAINLGSEAHGFCKSDHFEGKLQQERSWLGLNASFEQCEVAELPAIVETNGCLMVSHITDPSEGIATSGWNCPEGSAGVKVKVYFDSAYKKLICTATLSTDNAFPESAIFWNQSGGVQMGSAIHGMSYMFSGSSCPLPSGSDGTLEGQANLQGS